MTPMVVSAEISLAFVSSAYNEEKNLEELYIRCFKAYETVCSEFVGSGSIRFHFIVADNASEDNSVALMKQLCQKESAATLLINHKNYGPEASVANALRFAGGYDIIILLCSDLQDPPELAVTMTRHLLKQAGIDAVLAVKERSAGNKILRLARRCYYRVLGYSTRLQRVPSGFHGFGCYRREVIEEALRYWEKTDLNLRQCLANACHSPMHISYQQADRVHGVSSYRGIGYWSEALRSLAAGDASASRLALLIGSGGMLIGGVAALLLVFNFLRGDSGYSAGVPTVMALILLSFTLQMLMIGLLSRQIEALRLGGLRPRVHFRAEGASLGSTDHQVSIGR